MEILLKIIAIVIQTSLCIYVTLSFVKILGSKYSSTQLVLTIILYFISIFLCNLIKGLFPLSNTILAIIMFFINFKFILKINTAKSVLLAILSFTIGAIAELFSYSIVNIVSHKNSVYLLSNNFSLVLLSTLQLLFALILINAFKKILNKYTNIKDLIINITAKQLITFTTLLCICVLPQLLIFIFHKYEYSLTFILLNSIQIIVICMTVFFYISKSLENSKTQTDLITSELHNKTMVGMVDRSTNT